MDEDQNCAAAAGESAPLGTAGSLYDDPAFLKMQARSAALAHAVSIANTPIGTDIIANAEKFAAFLMG